MDLKNLEAKRNWYLKQLGIIIKQLEKLENEKERLEALVDTINAILREIENFERLEYENKVERDAECGVIVDDNHFEVD